MDARDLYAGCLAVWSEQAAAVGREDWGNATPCSEWDVRALVNHIVGEEFWIRPLLEGKTIADVGDKFDGDLLGDDPLQIAKEAESDSADAVASLFAGIETVHLSYGDETADGYIRQISADHLIHAWDLATGIGREITFPPDLMSDVASWFGGWESLYRQFGAIADQGTSDGTAQGDLLAAFGRSTA